VAMQTRAPGRRVALIFTKSTTTRDSGCEVHWTRALSWKPSRNLPCWAPLLAARTARRTGARAGAEAGRQNRATAELRAVKLEAVADMMEVCLGGQRVVIEGCIRDLRCCSALAKVYVTSCCTCRGPFLSHCFCLAGDNAAQAPH